MFLIRLHIRPKLLLAVFSALLLLLALICVPLIIKAAEAGRFGKLNAGYSRTVIIDPGHGGPDGGAVGVDGVVEKGINLSISLKLRSYFIAAGYTVIMTREDDRTIADEGSKTIRSKKNTDLHNRLDIVDAYPNALFISIHQNIYSSAQYSGTQVFYSPNNPCSKDLATLWQSTVKNQLQPDNSRAIKPAEDNLFILYHAKSPAVMVECGFLSNPGECKKLEDNAYQNQMAFSIFSGTLQYYSQD
jgi:N-acetylmuramoyl-L-alanine amidase